MQIKQQNRTDDKTGREYELNTAQLDGSPDLLDGQGQITAAAVLTSTGSLPTLVFYEFRGFDTIEVAGGSAGDIVTFCVERDSGSAARNAQGSTRFN